MGDHVGNHKGQQREIFLNVSAANISRSKLSLEYIVHGWR